MTISTLCYVWRLERPDGFVVRGTDHDRPLTFLGEEYSPKTGVTATKIKQKLGLGTDNLEVSGLISSETITETDIEAGLFDGSAVDIYIVNWADTTDYRNLVHGNFGTVYLNEQGYTSEIRSQSYFLAQETGRTFQRTCDTKLGSLPCGVNLNQPAYTTTASVVSLSEAVLVVDDLSQYDADWFSLGKVQSPDGFVYGVRLHEGNTLYLWQDPVNTIEPGTDLIITAGCRQDAQTCRVKFNNIDNFQGFPFMPGNDAISDYPIIGQEDYDGGSLFND